MPPNSDNIKYLVIIGISVMLLLFTSFLVAVILNQRKKLKYQRDMEKLREQQQNQLIEAAVRSEELERHRIAETLHDEVGAILSSAKLHLLGIKSEVLDERDQKLHEKGRELLNEVIQKVRGISHNLHSNILKEFGLNEAIRHFVKKVTQGTMLQATTALDDNYKTENAENDISIYRMVQELMNNILKYANATEFLISSTLVGNELNLVLFHNGDGLTQEQFEELRFRKEGLGLKNIQNRIILLKGTIHFTRGGEGYRINIHVPVKTNNAA
jgi:two-component system NarL family sensor kinase